MFYLRIATVNYLYKKINKINSNYTEFNFLKYILNWGLKNNKNNNFSIDLNFLKFLI
jgi:hypothetical protein